MSRGANLSILGLYNNDSTIFDMMVFPDGFTDAQKQTVTDNILVECAEFECLYPNPYVMKNIIGVWSRKELPYWNRVYTASQAEYNPIENYRRNETESVEDGRTEEHSGSDINRASGSDTNSGSSSSTDTDGGTDTVNNSVTGYDSNDLVMHDRTQTQYGHTLANAAQGTNTQQYGRVDTMQHGEKIEHEGSTDRTMLAYGNIGVTTSQEMLTQELELAKIIEVIPIIIESFKNRFCLLVY